jgi:hypothetical protein
MTMVYCQYPLPPRAHLRTNPREGVKRLAQAAAEYSLSIFTKPKSAAAWLIAEHPTPSGVCRFGGTPIFLFSYFL